MRKSRSAWPHAAYAPWFGVAFDAWRLSMEAGAVIAQRSMLMAAGGAGAQDEAARMVAEKVQAGLELQARALTGGLSASPATAARQSLAHYRRKVRANGRRLAK